MEKIRRSKKAFVTQADMRTVDTGDRNVLCIDRSYEGEEILGIFNFSEFDKEVSLSGIEGEYTDVLTGRKIRPEKIKLSAYGFYWLASVANRKADVV